MSNETKPSDFSFSGVGTLLLSDITEFAAPTPVISPEELIQVMGRILEVEHRCIHESQGSMPYAGAGEVILAVWSCPSHAAVALETGRRILVGAQTVQAETGFSLQLRMALTTGKMTVTIIGDRPQVYGAPFTTALRLLDLTIPRGSRLLCTSETLDLISEQPHSDSVATVRGCSGQEVGVFEFTS